MYRVTIFPSLSSAHLSQVFTGLYELRAAGIVDLRANIAPARWAGAHIYNVLAVEATDLRGTELRRIIFDVRDEAVIEAALLAQADVYFKRTCDRAVIASLPESLRGRVEPFGLNYACATDAQFRNLAYARQLYAIDRADSESNSDPLRTFRRRVSLPLRWIGAGRHDVSANAPISYRRIETDANVPAHSAVLFLSRLWNPCNTPRSDPLTLKRINRTRIELVRTLRRRLGARFVGGVQRDPFSEAQCPDCVTDVGACKANYLELMRSQLVAVTSEGLHGSIGWKLAEYVAASRCIVSEPLCAMLPGSFVAGRHYLEYRTPDECADACERILDDPAFANAMRRDNAEYYQCHLKPPALMLQHLQTAAATEPNEIRGVR